MSAMHQCPAPRCDTQVTNDMFACRMHWAQIPDWLRSKMWREFKNNFGRPSYFRVRADCLRALGVAEEDIANDNAGVA